MQVLIVDDEPIAISILEKYIRQVEGLEVAGTCRGAVEAFNFLQKTPVGLLLLDIEMPQMSGLAFLKSLQNPPPVILTTAYRDYALEGFELAVADYLLKPVKYERFQAAIAKVQKRMAPTEAPAFDHFFLKSGHEVVRIDHDDVMHITAMRDYVAVHTRSRGRILSLEHLRDLEARLPADRYCRIHRSHIVALKAVIRVERDHVVLDGTHLPISDTYAKRFRALLGV